MFCLVKGFWNILLLISAIKISLLALFCIFMYNSEMWTLTEKLENTVDIFQRLSLRRIINVKWPKKISNKDLYEKKMKKPWSKEIKWRRLNWTGHLLWLPAETPARQTLIESQRSVKRPTGKPKLALFCLVTSELSRLDIDLNDINKATEKAQDRYAWTTLVERAMSLDE